MNRQVTRRDGLKAALTLPATSWMARYEALAAPLRDKVKITAVKAMQVRGIAGNCLTKIETDPGLAGYGEAGATGPVARTRIREMIAARLLIGGDPLSIERHFHEMTTRMYTCRPHIPTISGIDIALWDLGRQDYRPARERAHGRAVPRQDSALLARGRLRSLRSLCGRCPGV